MFTICPTNTQSCYPFENRHFFSMAEILLSIQQHRDLDDSHRPESSLGQALVHLPLEPAPGQASAHVLPLQHLSAFLADLGSILNRSPGHSLTQALLGVGAAGGVWAMPELAPGYSG